MLMESGDEEEKEHAILCIQKLAYNDHISTVLKEKTRVEEVLNALGDDRKVSTAVRTALEILQHGPPEKATDMISRKSVQPGSISTIKLSDLSVGRMVAGGGFGRVYKGYHKRWMMQVAVKQLRPLSKEQSLRLSKALIEEAKFMHQARNAYRFIVPLYGVCVEEKFTALVMDFMENGSVGDLMLCVKPVPWALRWRILHETILGMNFLHSLDPKIIHHDLKIQNVLLDEDFHAKITDFGLSEYKYMASGGKDEKGGIFGTMTHIPPEHFAQPHLKAGEEFDVYSFGILIWEILTGRQPFEGINNSALIRLGVMKGQRPTTKLIPKEGPNELPFFLSLMEECWHPNAAKRPTFRSLGKRIGTVIQRTNLMVAEAILAVRSALAKEEESASQDPERREVPAVAGALAAD
ncbi:RIPK4 [Branchiostoma lanceolatum]|uniref:RIPK4 protein n=1 Tax=Branchiostoma lanceolatum TaxID=7740 RepID=A0A8K0AFP6_BRALA|nr:RIPK4 [Branchiostoma lanceolatum]